MINCGMMQLNTDWICFDIKIKKNEAAVKLSFDAALVLTQYFKFINFFSGF